MAGYIEHLGTGTTDMIADCEALGLRTPEFIQADDFRTIIYRQEKVSDPAEKVSNQTEKVTEQGQKVTEQGQKVIEQEQKSNQAEQESNQVRLTAKQRKVLEFCDVMPRTAQEILEMEGVKYQTRTLQQYVTKLVLAGLLRPTTTHKNDSNRRYITAHPSTDRWAGDDRVKTEKQIQRFDRDSHKSQIHTKMYVDGWFIK